MRIILLCYYVKILCVSYIMEFRRAKMNSFYHSFYDKIYHYRFYHLNVVKPFMAITFSWNESMENPHMPT